MPLEFRRNKKKKSRPTLLNADRILQGHRRVGRVFVGQIPACFLSPELLDAAVETKTSVNDVENPGTDATLWQAPVWSLLTSSMTT